MRISKYDNNWYKIEDFDFASLVEKLKKKITEYDPEVYRVIFKWLSEDSALLHKFFALDLFILERMVGNTNDALEVYEKTVVNYLFKKISPQQPNLENISFVNNLKTPKIYQRTFIENYGKLKALLKLDGYMLSMQPGMGKSFTAILTALAYSKNQILILCPKTLTRSVWEVELQDLNISDYCVYPYDKELDKKFVITNYEKVSDLVNKIKCDFLIIDESQNFRFADRKKLQQIYEFKLHQNLHDILLLTGTPIKGLYAEFSAAFLLLDPLFDMDAYPYFMALYNRKNIAGERLLKERLNYYMFKLSYETVRDEFVLPTLHQITKEVELPDAQKYTIRQIRLDIKQSASECKLQINKDSVINEINTKYNLNLKKEMSLEDIVLKKQELLSKLESEKEKKEASTLFNQLIAPEIYCLSKNIATSYIRRLKELVLELFKHELTEINNLLMQNEKIVIFTNYVSIADQLKELFDKTFNLNTKVVTGKYSLDMRTEHIKKFKESPGADIIIITYKAASYGLTLTEARYLYYADLPFRDADLKQAIARIYRLTQQRDAYAIYLKLKSEEITIQDKKEKILELYRELVAELLDVPVNETILRELYDDLEKLILK